MDNIIQKFHGRSGHKSHEAEYLFPLDDVFMLNMFDFSEEYRNASEMFPFKWVFSMTVRKVYPQDGDLSMTENYFFFLRMKRTDDLLTPISFDFMLILSDLSGIELAAFPLPGAKIKFRGEIATVFDPFEYYPKLRGVLDTQPLNITLYFRFFDCQKKMEKLDVCSSVDESSRRSSKQCKL